MDKPLDLNEPVRTRDGRDARVICTDRKGNGSYPVVALITEKNGVELALSYKTDGASTVGYQADLVNVPPPNRFINLYNSSIFGKTPWKSLESAQRGTYSPSWKGTLEETADGEFVAFHPANPERSCE